jgi:hypothetical protein
MPVYIPEKRLVKELRLINPKLYPFFMDKYGKWFIVKDFPKHIPGITEYDPISGKNFVVEMVLEDKNHNPLPFDEDVIRFFRYMKHQKHIEDSADKEIKSVDAEEAARIQKAKLTAADMQIEFWKWGRRLKFARTFS